MTQGDPARIFFDASLIGAAKILAQRDNRIVYPGHPDWPYGQAEADEVWLGHVGGVDWLTILRDRKIRFRRAILRDRKISFRRAECQALIDNNVRAVNVAKTSNLTVGDTVDLLSDNWDDVERTLLQPPAFYQLTNFRLKQMLEY